MTELSFEGQKKSERWKRVCEQSEVMSHTKA
jgi:hypothetical protein